MMDKPEKIIPEHKEGNEVNVEDSVECRNEEEAKSFFQQVKERLLNVNAWHEFAGALSADFALTDSS